MLPTRLLTDFGNKIVSKYATLKGFKYQFGRGLYFDNNGNEIPITIYDPEEQFNNDLKSNVYDAITIQKDSDIQLTVNIDPFEDFTNKNYKYLYLYYDDLSNSDDYLIGAVIDISIDENFSPKKNYLSLDSSNINCDFEFIQSNPIDHLESTLILKLAGIKSNLLIDGFLDLSSGRQLIKDNSLNQQGFRSNTSLDKYGMKI